MRSNRDSLFPDSLWVPGEVAEAILPAMADGEILGRLEVLNVRSRGRGVEALLRVPTRNEAVAMVREVHRAAPRERSKRRLREVVEKAWGMRVREKMRVVA